MGRFLQNPVQHWHIRNSRHIQNPVKYLKWRILFRTMCNTSIQNPGIFRIQCIFRILSSIYHEIFYWKPCVTRPYSELKYIHNSVSEIKVYSEPCRISQIQHCQESRETIANLDTRYIQNFYVFKTRKCQLLLKNSRTDI